MRHLKPLFSLPVVAEVGTEAENVIIVGDSTLDLPGVRYGLTCILRQRGQNLLWIVCKPGAGVRELADVWNDAPYCHWGLTVANLNDALREVR